MTTPTPGAILDQLVSAVAQLLAVETDEIDADADLEHLGIDSVEGAMIAGDIADWLGTDIDPSLMWAHPTLRTAADAIARAVSAH